MTELTKADYEEIVKEMMSSPDDSDSFSYELFNSRIEQKKREKEEKLIAHREEVMSYARNQNYEQLEKQLNAPPLKSDNMFHTDIARIGVKMKDSRIVNMTDHFPRILMDEFAPDAELFEFLLDTYSESGWQDGNGAPSYVWRNCTLESAKILADKYGIPASSKLVGCSEEVINYFRGKY